MTTWGAAFAPMREQNFRWYYFAQVVNMAGSSMVQVALAFAVLEISDSVSALGQVLAAHTIAMIVFLLFGGVVADRLPRVLLMRVGNLVLFGTQATAGLLVVTGTAEIWHLVCLEIVNGLVLGMTLPALAAVMPQLVSREHLQQANVLRSMSNGALRIVGPTIGALLVVTVGPGWALVVDAATWLLSALLLVRVRIPAREKSAHKTSPFTELREGWTLFSGTPWLWIIVLVFGILNAIHVGAWFTLGPVVAKDTIGEAGWGLILSAESIGLLLMTAVMLRYRLERPLLLGMVGISTLAVPMLVLGVHPSLVVLVVVTFAAGAGTEVFNLGWNLAMQENIEERMLSRAYSYDMLGSFVAMPIGQLAIGPLVLAYGREDVLVAAGVVYLVIAMAALLSPSVRNLRRAPAPG